MKRDTEVVRIKLTAEAKLLMVKGEQCSADNDWHEARLAWKEARRATEALVLPGETAGVLMYEECVYLMLQGGGVVWDVHDSAATAGGEC